MRMDLHFLAHMITMVGGFLALKYNEGLGLYLFGVSTATGVAFICKYWRIEG